MSCYPVQYNLALMLAHLQKAVHCGLRLDCRLQCFNELLQCTVHLITTMKFTDGCVQ